MKTKTKNTSWKEVYILPLRNENGLGQTVVAAGQNLVYILPLRNENKRVNPRWIPSNPVYILPLRNENWTFQYIR